MYEPPLLFLFSSAKHSTSAEGIAEHQRPLRPKWRSKVFNRLGQMNILRKFHQNPERAFGENEVSLFQWPIY